jgi:spermidine synthase
LPSCARDAGKSTPPPNPLPQGEGEKAGPDQHNDDHAPHVLIGGLGLGYTLRAALDHLPPAARITVAELLPEIIALNRGPLAPFAGYPLADPRVSVACADIATLLRTAAPTTFDAILLDTDNGPDAVMLQGNAALYQPNSLRLIGRALRLAGTLAVWSADRSPTFEATLRASGFHCLAHDVPARGAPEDPLHTIYLARAAA